LSGSANQPPYLESSLAGFLELVSAGEPAPAGGSAAAVAVGLAAALSAMAARLSTDQLAEASDLVAGSEALRDRAGVLAQADAAAYGLVVMELRSPRESDPKKRHRRVQEALSVAAGVPTEIAEIGADVAAIAAQLAERGNPNLLGDALTAALLAEAATRAAAALVMINLKSFPDDERVDKTARAVARSAESAARARRILDVGLRL
jgi:formiminotetrahydrofolate cyclodeaminase